MEVNLAWIASDYAHILSLRACGVVVQDKCYFYSGSGDNFYFYPSLPSPAGRPETFASFSTESSAPPVTPGGSEYGNMTSNYSEFGSLNCGQSISSAPEDSNTRRQGRLWFPHDGQKFPAEMNGSPMDSGHSHSVVQGMTQGRDLEMNEVEALPGSVSHVGARLLIGSVAHNAGSSRGNVEQQLHCRRRHRCISVRIARKSQSRIHGERSL